MKTENLKILSEMLKNVKNLQSLSCWMSLIALGYQLGCQVVILSVKNNSTETENALDKTKSTVKG